MAHIIHPHHPLVRHLKSMTPLLGELLLTPWKQGVLNLLQHHLKHDSDEPDTLHDALTKTTPEVQHQLRHWEQRIFHVFQQLQLNVSDLKTDDPRPKTENTVQDKNKTQDKTDANTTRTA